MTFSYITTDTGGNIFITTGTETSACNGLQVLRAHNLEGRYIILKQEKSEI
jgi:hypothetical protein